LSGGVFDPLPVQLSLKIAKVVIALSAAIAFLTAEDADKEEAKNKVKEAQERMDELLILVESSIEHGKEQRG
jgi:hypothetical protein